jgi:hypothetical protein
MSKAHTWYNSLTSEDSTVTTIDIGPVVMLKQRFSSWIKWIYYAKDLRNFLATKSIGIKHKKNGAQTLTTKPLPKKPSDLKTLDCV